MKATLEFDCPEEWDEFNVSSRAKELYFSLCDMDEWLRTQIKHYDKEYQEVRDELHEIMDINGVNLEMMK